MKLGLLDFGEIENNFALVGDSVERSVSNNKIQNVLVVEIDPNLADTAAFCDTYGINLNISANCVIVEAKRADKTQYAACLILATDRVDVNNIVRRQLDARKISFAPMDSAVNLTQMEYGGITPIGLPTDWPILIDQAIIEQQYIIIGSGLRRSKLLVPTKELLKLSNITITSINKSI